MLSIVHEQLIICQFIELVHNIFVIERATNAKIVYNNCDNNTTLTGKSALCGIEILFKFQEKRIMTPFQKCNHCLHP